MCQFLQRHNFPVQYGRQKCDSFANRLKKLQTPEETLMKVGASGLSGVDSCLGVDHNKAMLTDDTCSTPH